MSNEINNIQNQLNKILKDNEQNNNLINSIKEYQQNGDSSLNTKLTEFKHKIETLDSLLDNAKTNYNNLISHINDYDSYIDKDINTVMKNQYDLNSQIKSLQKNITETSDTYTQPTTDGVFIDYNTFSKIINYLSFFSTQGEIDPKFVDNLISTAKKQEQKQLMIKDQNDKLTVKKDEPRSVTRPLDINDIIKYITQQINNQQK